MSYDLHNHTTASDGSFTPGQLVTAAVELGLTGLAITDHDTCSGWAAGLAAAQGQEIRLIPGIEFSCQYDGEKEIHLLGYWLDPANDGLQRTLATLQQARLERNAAIVEKLRKAGFPLSWERVKQLAQGESAGRPHIAAALVEKGFAYCLQDAFRKFLNPGGLGYVPRYKLDPLACLDLIGGAGGVGVFAHPGTAGCDYLIPALKEAGLKGLEAYHPNHGHQQEGHYLALCRDLGFVATGGSDCHVGGLGSKTCSDEAVAALEKFRHSA